MTNSGSGKESAVNRLYSIQFLPSCS